MAVYGVYRGVCVDNKDPLGQGRVRVVVPQVLGDAASGWAFPSWGNDDLVTWPEDRIPKPGQGVWILFEGSDRLTWISAFGPQEFSEQHKEGDPDYYGTALTMDLSVLPVGIAVPVTGVFSSPAGIPWPGSLIRLEKHAPDPDLPPAVEGDWALVDDWELIDTGEPTLDGNWSVDYSRSSTEEGWWYRASYVGIEPYTSSEVMPPQQVPIPADSSSITWNDPEPVWQVPTTVYGYLVAGSDGVGIGSLPVHLYIKLATGPWIRSMSTKTKFDGSWSMDWIRTKAMTEPMEIRAVYLGSEDYDYSQVPVPSKTLDKVQVPVDITWLPPKNFDIGVSQNYSGTIRSDYGVPEPNPIVYLQVRSPAAAVSSAGVWVNAASTPVRSDGTWDLNYTVKKATGDYRAYFPGAGGVYLPALTDEVSQVTYLATNVTTPVVPSPLYYGTPFLVTGAVTDERGNSVTDGQVILEMIETTASGGDWGPVYGAVPTTLAANGTYSITHPSPTFAGSVQYRVSYLDNPDFGYQPSTSTAISRTVGLRTPVLVKGAIDHGSASFSWVAVPGATLYRVYRYAGNVTVGDSTARVYVDIGSSTSYTATGLTANTDYQFTVRCFRLDAGGSWVPSLESSPIKCNTGVAEVRNIGSFIRDTAPTATRSWRPLDGWTTFTGDDVAQGYFGSSGSYQGVMTYDGPGFRNWVVANYGQAVLNNLIFNSTQFFMKRNSSSGGSGAVSLYWVVTSAVAGSGTGPFPAAGGEFNGALSYNQEGWIALQSYWWGRHILMNENLNGNGGVYVCNSFMLQHNSSDHYARFLGVSTGHCILRVGCNWNFQIAPDVPARWY